MSELDRYPNRGRLIAITLCVVALVVAVVLYFVWNNQPVGQPVDLPESSSSSSEPAPPPESSSEPAPTPEPVVSAPPASSSAPTVSSAPPSTPPVTVTPTPAMVTIDRPGTYATKETYRQVVVTTGDVLVSNKTVTGNLFIMDEVGDGDVTLENVVVQGTLYIYGGGENTVTLRDVQAQRVHLQKDLGTLGVLASGATQLDNVLVKCHALLTEENLTGQGFKNITIEQGQKAWYEIALQDVVLDSLTVNDAANVHLSKDCEIGAVYANDAVHFSGSGSMRTLEVRHDRVSYESAPRNIVVKSGYVDPTHGGAAIGSPEEERGHSGSGGSGSPAAVRLSTPADLTIVYDGQLGAFRVRFGEVKRSAGYLVTPYLKSNGLGTALPAITLEGSGTTEAVVLPNAAQYLGRELQVKVKALGDSAQNTLDSYEASTAYTTVARLDPPKGLKAQLQQTAQGLSYQLTWEPVENRCRGYVVTAVYQDGQPNQLRSEQPAATFSFDRGGDADKTFIFAVTALPKEDTTLMDSLPSEAQVVRLSVMPEVGDLRICQEEAGLTAHWSFAGNANADHFEVIPCLDGQELNPDKPILVPALAAARSEEGETEQLDHQEPSASEFSAVLLTPEQLEAAIGSTLTVKVRTVAKEGHISSEYAISSEAKLQSLPAPTGAAVYYSAGGTALEQEAGYYYTWQPVPGAGGYRVTPILLRNGEETAYPAVDLPADTTTVRAWNKTGSASPSAEVETFKAGDQLTFTVQSLSGIVGQQPMAAARCAPEKMVTVTQLPGPTALLLQEAWTETLAADRSVLRTAAYEAQFTPGAATPDGIDYLVTPYVGEIPQPVQRVTPAAQANAGPSGNAQAITVALPAPAEGRITSFVVQATRPAGAEINSPAVQSVRLVVMEPAIRLTSEWTAPTADREGELTTTLSIPAAYAGKWTLTLHDPMDASKQFSQEEGAVLAAAEGQSAIAKPVTQLVTPLFGKATVAAFQNGDVFVVTLSRTTEQGGTMTVQSPALTVTAGEKPVYTPSSSSSVPPEDDNTTISPSSSASTSSVEDDAGGSSSAAADTEGSSQTDSSTSGSSTPSASGPTGNPSAGGSSSQGSSTGEQAAS